MGEEKALEDLDIRLIVAMSENGVIGKQGGIPWHIPEDLKRFKALTEGKNVIMGRKTYESLPKNVKPLPKRDNLVLSHGKIYDDGVKVFSSVDDVLDYIGNELSYVIGGENVYKQFMPYANTIELTRLYRQIEGDTFFPQIDGLEWYLSNVETKKQYDEGNSEIFSFETYKRRGENN